MRKKIIELIYNPLISGSVTIFIGSHVANVFNLLFSIFTSRNLSPADYGSFISLVSLLSLVTLPAGSMTLSIVRFAGLYFAKNDLGMVRGLFLRVFKICLLLAVSTLLILTLFQGQIGEFFKIDNKNLILIISLAAFFSFISVVNNSLLQAKLAFGFVSFSNLLGAVTKLIIGFMLILLGYSVVGALLAVFLSSLITYIVSFFPLRFLFNKEHKFFEILTFKKLFFYGAPASTALFAFAAFILTDILLVKHFFSPQDAGVYAAGLAIVGKIVFYISSPIGFVMFPLIVQKHSRNENYHRIFGLSLLLVLLASIPILACYYLFPEFIIEFIVKKTEYLAVSKQLWFFGLWMTVYSLLAVVVNFYLSINKTKIVIPLSIGAVFQALGIWMFHDTFFQVILISFIITSLLLIILLLYYYKNLYAKKS